MTLSIVFPEAKQSYGENTRTAIWGVTELCEGDVREALQSAPEIRDHLEELKLFGIEAIDD